MTPLAVLVALLSGLHGIVTRGPTTPVCRVGTPCSAPAVGAVLVFSRNGTTVAHVRAGAGGRYSVTLAPGVYRVTVGSAPRSGSGIRPENATVRPGVDRRVDFLIDTGIR